MLVYRVENERGIGPYLSFSPLLEDMGKAHADRGHPDPYDDGITGMMASEYCAVRSLEDAQTWFDGYGEVLDEAGFELNVWEAQDVTEGVAQVVFRKDTARVVASYPIMEYIR